VSSRVSSAAVDPRYAWLGLVLPSDARRFRTDNPQLAAVLAEAGAETVTSAPDVEITEQGHLRGDATAAVVPFYHRRGAGGSRVARGAGRIARGAGLSLSLRRASREARRLGYASSFTISWERSIPVVGPGLPKATESPWAHRLPSNAVVVAHRNGPGRTIFDEVVDAAGRATGQVLRPRRVVFGSSGVVVADLGAVVLRLAVGPAAERLHAHRDTLERLDALDAPDDVRSRIPSLTAHGQEGLATWTLEERLPGAHPSRPDRGLVEDVAAFLAQLGRLPATGSAQSRLEAATEAIASECRKHVGESVARIAASALEDLDGCPACFVHGDFWTGNLLVEGNRLTGVIDWSAGGSDGLPMTDALHLQLSELRQGTHRPLGAAVAEYFLSGDELDYDVLGACGARLGLRLTRREQRALVVAYWLDALARELRDPDSHYDGDRAGWERDNVAPVLRVLIEPVTKQTS
jgi:hypothetical protein